MNSVTIFKRISAFERFLTPCKIQFEGGHKFLPPNAIQTRLTIKSGNSDEIIFDENQTFLKVKINDEKYQEMFDKPMMFERITFSKIAEHRNFSLNQPK